MNVPHPLSNGLVEEIKRRGIVVCPTLAGSAYSVLKFLRAPRLLFEDADLTANVPARVRRDLYLALQLLRLPGVARALMREPQPMRKWDLWYEQSLANTGMLYRAGVKLIFGTDTPFAFGNFHHSIMNEVRALSLAGIPNLAILRMATAEAAAALGIGDKVGTIEPGKVADLVLLEGDPFSDLEAMGRVALVVKEGRIVYRKT